MELFKEFVRGQENAQDSLNENFNKLENPYKVLFEGEKKLSEGNVTLIESIANFRVLIITFSSRGNRMTATYSGYGSKTDIKVYSGNIADSSASVDWDIFEVYATIENNIFSWNYSKNVTNKGVVTNPSDDISLVNIIGWY